MTTAPCSAATGASARLTSPLADMNAKSTSPKSSGVASSTAISSPMHFKLLADRALGRAQADVGYGEVALFEHIKEYAPDGAGSADDRDAGRVHGLPPGGEFVSISVGQSVSMGLMIMVFGGQG